MGGAHLDARFTLKVASRLVPDGWVELRGSGCRCCFRAFQLELDNPSTKNFGIGSVVKKLQLFVVGRILENLGGFAKFKQKSNEN